MFHVPKVYLDPSKKSGGILEFRVLGDQTKSLSTTFGQSKTVSSTAILVLISKFGSASSNSIETPLIASLSFFGSLSTHERNKEAEGGYAVSYIQQDGTKKTVYAKDGWNLLDLAHSNNIELEGHVVMQKEFYEKLEEPSDEENDMLDLAFGLTET
ncbi:Adrenodoxin-like protein 1, mitochondrial [Chytriomyces hyalinus]|nr:Adrenodoxin-like protein 1, mitochondrial [Chytriomyces hyalinus]